MGSGEDILDSGMKEETTSAGAGIADSVTTSAGLGGEAPSGARII